MEIEKGPVDLFPTEPTNEDRQVEETLNLWVQGTPRPVILELGASVYKQKRTKACTLVLK